MFSLEVLNYFSLLLRVLVFIGIDHIGVLFFLGQSLAKAYIKA